MNKAQLALRINDLARIKSRQSELDAEAEALILVIKKHGGGESSKWIAELVKMPKRTVVIKAHKQLRLYAKS